MQNELGMKPADTALASGKRSTAELLLTYQASLSLTRDLLARERTQEALAAENQEIRTQFRCITISAHSSGTQLEQDTVQTHSYIWP